MTCRGNGATRMFYRWSRISVFGLALAVVSCATVWANVLNVTTTKLGQGMWEYDLTLTDPYPFPLSGLNILQGYTVFGLDSTSTITVPPGWGFFPPIPNVVDELSGLSFSFDSDAQPGIPLSGFSFDSTTDPATLTGPIRFDLINGITGDQVPEPETMPTVLMCLAVASRLKQRGAES